MAVPTDQDAVVFLDVDGVLGARVSMGDEVNVTVPPRMRPLVQRLSSIAEVVWATSWGFEVRERLTALFELPTETRGLAVTRGSDPREAKRLAIDRFVRLNRPAGGWRALVWVDDQIRPVDRMWAAGTGLPLDLVAVDASALLTARDVAEVERAVTARSSSR